MNEPKGNGPGKTNDPPQTSEQLAPNEPKGNGPGKTNDPPQTSEQLAPSEDLEDLAARLPDVDTLVRALDEAGYLADQALGTALFLAEQTAGAVLKYAEDLEVVRDRGFAEVLAERD